MENKEKKEYKPTQTKEQAEKQLRITYLAAKGIDTLRKEITTKANEQIDALNEEVKKIIELNEKATKDLEYYVNKEKTKEK